jgi:hypothetical protein
VHDSVQRLDAQYGALESQFDEFPHVSAMQACPRHSSPVSQALGAGKPAIAQSA